MSNKLKRQIKGLLKCRDMVVAGSDIMREYGANDKEESNAVRDIENEIFIKKVRELVRDEY